MGFKILTVLSILSIVGSSRAFPTSIDEFYQALHKQVTPKQRTVSDACQSIANKEVVQYKEAVDCYNSFPLADSVRRNTLDSLKKTLEFYVFKDIVAKSPDENVPSDKDIDSEWKKVSNYKFNTEFEFNSFMNGYFNTFHDGHTAYSSKCYTSFEFKQPFPIYIHGSEVRILTEIEFPEEYIRKWSKLGLDVMKYQGSKVMKINDKEPLEYMKLYSHFYIGISRDINSRLNFGSARVIYKDGEYGINHGMFANSLLVPLESTVTYSLKTPDGEIHKVIAPYLVQSPKNFQDSKSYYSKNCKMSDEKTPDGNNMDYEAPSVKNTLINQALIKSRRSKRDVKLQFLTGSQATQSYLLGESTGVLVINHFIGDDRDMFSGLSNAFNAFKIAKVKKLILDLSNNIGGDKCQGYDVLNGLFPGAKKYLTDMRSTPLLVELTDNNSIYELSPFNYNKPDGTSFDSFKAFKKQLTYPRGNRINANFTPKFQESCNEVYSPLPMSFASEDVSVVTNTICLSTCTVLVNSLQELYNVTTYALGGDPSLQAPPASMGGGGAIHFSHFSSWLAGKDWKNQGQVPGALPEHASFSFTLREAYSHNHKDRPLEFTFLPATHRIPYDEKTVNHPKFVWDLIAKKSKNIASSYYNPRS